MTTIRCGGWFFEPGDSIPINDRYELEKFIDMRNYGLTRFNYVETVGMALRVLETPLSENYENGIFYIRAYQSVGEELGGREVMFGLGLPGMPNEKRKIFMVNLCNLGRGAPRRNNIVKYAFKRLNDYLVKPFENLLPKEGVLPIHGTRDFYEIVRTYDDKYNVMYYNKREDQYSNISNWIKLRELVSGIAEGTYF